MGPIINPWVNIVNDWLNGYLFDNAGKTARDAESRRFTYDAENKQVEVENSLEQSIGKYWFDVDGKRITKEGTAPNGQPELTVFVYDAAGAVTSMQLGNGRWESTVFNSRLQPVQIALGSTGTGAQAYDLLKLDWCEVLTR